MNGWLAVTITALVVSLPRGAWAADDANGAARELARRTVAYAGRGEPVAVSWRNVSSLDAADLQQVRAAFDSAVRESGGRVSDIAPVAEARFTISENQTQFLLVEEARKGDDRQVWIASWKRGVTPAAPASGAVNLTRKLLWEQEEQILDAAVAGEGVLALSPTRVTLRAQSVPIAPRAGGWPRDLRGHLRVNGSSFKAFLPGVVCTGSMEPMLAMECRASEEPWALDTLLATFVPSRNYFDGHIVLANGTRKSVPPFFSVAPVADGWVFTMPGGRTEMFNAALESTGAIGGWGSDIAATSAHCAGGSQLLATRPGSPGEPDAIRAFNRSTAITAPLDMPGPVTALWSAGGNSATAIVKDLATARWSAYEITVNCE